MEASAGLQLQPLASSLVEPPQPPRTEDKRKLYPQRWLMLIVLCLLNATSQMLWLSFAPATDVVGIFYHVSNDSVNMLALVFQISLVIVGFPTIWIINTKDLKFSMILGAWLNAAGAVVRMFSGFDFVPSDARFAVSLAGQILASTAQGVPLFGITKLAATWFPDGQRALVSSVASMSNPLGLLLAYTTVPLLVTRPEDVGTMLIALGCPAVATAVIVSAGVRSARPPTPPSISTASEPQAFFLGMKQIMKNKQFWIIIFVFGAGFGLFSALFTVLQQELCRHSYDNMFSGLCGILMISCGIGGAVLAGLLADKTKKFEEIAKVLYTLTFASLVFYCIISCFADQKPAVAVATSLIGFFGLALYPVLLELAVEVTYPVAEATSCGLITVSGGLHGVVLLVIVQALSVPLTEAETSRTTCQTTANDFTYANIFLECTVALIGIIFIICLRPTYKRLEAEIALKKPKAAELQTKKAYADYGSSGLPSGDGMPSTSLSGHSLHRMDEDLTHTARL